jgi:hypothetical protein
MRHRSLALLLPLAFLLVGCDSDGSNAGADLAVTGFVITTPERPEVDLFRACGRPARTSGLITAVPNPYRGVSAYEEDPDNRRLRFINLPERVRIEIVSAYWFASGAPREVETVAGGVVRVYSPVGRTVRVLKKASPSRSLDWDLRDARGEFVPSGFYRAYFTSPSLPGRVFEDLYIIQREDSSDLLFFDDGEVQMLGDGSWTDPTGCL